MSWRVAFAAVLIGVALSGSAACGSPESPILIVETDADELVRGDYSLAQVEAYKEALQAEALTAPRPEGMSLNFNVSDEDWQPYLVRAKAFCDDARARGWDDARVTYERQLRDSLILALPDEAANSSVVDDFLKTEFESLLMSQMRALAAPGSLCPELAPLDLRTEISSPSPKSSVFDESLGTYFGEGCESGVGALNKVLELLPRIEERTITPPDFADELVDVSAALMYGEMTESVPGAAAAMGEAALSVALFAEAVEALDAEASSAMQIQVAENAINVLDQCGSAYPGRFR